ncbi:membrane dipeptidase [Acidaminobacter sp. JC074]|uniref:dipeptidase n=1 Tax=Acidaminobacter sp. JC074 TaxID=2530199 RepID=UPI001F0FB053|nr:dipeptidase [Acidaminobacter sp. JC074]MCH4890606.1 membrane dipeptidase [Acidaminobacter sp. JC074]
MKLFDLHCDTILRIYGDKTELKKNDYHIDIDKMKQGHSLGQFFAMFVDLKSTQTPFKTCNEMIDCFEHEMNLNKEAIKAGKTYHEIVNNKEITGIVTIEEGAVLEGKIDNLDHFYKRGVRSITLTWNYENEIGYPNCKDEFRDKGLKPFGLEVVKRMNDLGMLIDVSHLSDGGFWDCIKHSTKPIIASHSNARAVQDVSRNLTDDMILALRDKGGVMGMNFCAYFLDGSKASKVKDIVRHVRYIYDLAGIDVIAMGTDFDGIGGELEISDMSKMNLLVEALRQDGFTEEEIEKIFYKNALRVLEALK